MTEPDRNNAIFRTEFWKKLPFELYLYSINVLLLIRWEHLYW